MLCLRIVLTVFVLVEVDGRDFRGRVRKRLIEKIQGKRRERKNEIVASAAGSRGYLFVSNRPDEVVYAVHRLRKVSPKANITYIADAASVNELKAWKVMDYFDLVFASEEVFPDIGVWESMGFRLQKLRGMLLTPYEYTIYMDSDTLACSSIDDLFDTVRHVDLAMTWGGRGNHTGASAGVLAYSRTISSWSVWRAWEEEYRQVMTKSRREQPAFQLAVRSIAMRSGLTVKMLPTIYNCRNMHSCRLSLNATLKDGSHRLCKVIHGHTFDQEKEDTGQKETTKKKKEASSLLLAQKATFERMATILEQKNCPVLSGAHRLVYMLDPPTNRRNWALPRRANFSYEDEAAAQLTTSFLEHSSDVLNDDDDVVHYKASQEQDSIEILSAKKKRHRRRSPTEAGAGDRIPTTLGHALFSLTLNNDFSICDVSHMTNLATPSITAHALIKCQERSRRYAVVVYGDLAPRPNLLYLSAWKRLAPVFIALARHPLDRLLQQIHANPGNTQQTPKSRVEMLQLCLADTSTFSNNHIQYSCFERKLKLRDNSDTSWFCGGTRLCDQRATFMASDRGGAALEQAKYVIRTQFLVIGLADHLHAFARELERALPSHFLQLTAKIKEIESDPIRYPAHRQSVTPASRRTRQAQMLPPELIREFETSNALDFALYSFIRDRFLSRQKNCDTHSLETIPEYRATRPPSPPAQRTKGGTRRRTVQTGNHTSRMNFAPAIKDSVRNNFITQGQDFSSLPSEIIHKAPRRRPLPTPEQVINSKSPLSTRDNADTLKLTVAKAALPPPVGASSRADGGDVGSSISKKLSRSQQRRAHTRRWQRQQRSTSDLSA